MGAVATAPFFVLRGRRTRGFRGEASCKSPAVQGGRDAEASYSPLKIPFVFRAVEIFLALSIYKNKNRSGVAEVLSNRALPLIREFGGRIMF